MKELDKALDIALGGPEAEKALEAFRQRLTAWGLVMPPVEPLVLDFGLGDFTRFGHIECWIANEMEAGYCGKYIFVADGQTCPMHRHKQKHETFYIVKGQVRMVVDEKEQTMSEGDLLTMPPGKVHSFTGMGNALLLELSTPCLLSDNEFQDQKIAHWLTSNLK